MHSQVGTYDTSVGAPGLFLVLLYRSSRKQRLILTVAVAMLGLLVGTGAHADPNVEDIAMAYAGYAVCPSSVALATYGSTGKEWLRNAAGMGERTVQLAIDPYFGRYTSSLYSLKSSEQFCAALTAPLNGVSPTVDNFATMPHLTWPLQVADPAAVSAPTPVTPTATTEVPTPTGSTPVTADTTEMVTAFAPGEYKNVDPADISVSHAKFIGKPLQFLGAQCFYRDINEYSCGLPGAMVTVFASDITPTDAKTKLESDCGAVKKVDSPACRRTIRLVPKLIDEDNPSPMITRTVVETQAIEIVPTPVVAPHKRKH